MGLEDGRATTTEGETERDAFLQNASIPRKTVFLDRLDYSIPEDNGKTQIERANGGRTGRPRNTRPRVGLFGSPNEPPACVAVTENEPSTCH